MANKKLDQNMNQDKLSKSAHSLFDFTKKEKSFLIVICVLISIEFVMKNKGIMISEKHYLWPIPLEELNFNKAMDPQSDQNPGY